MTVHACRLGSIIMLRETANISVYLYVTGYTAKRYYNNKLKT